MISNDIDLDDASDGILYLGEAGVTTTISGSIKGVLILETYDGIKSKRLYKFLKDENSDECFMFASKDFEGIDCPNCGETQFIDDVRQSQDHYDDCNFIFDNKELLSLIGEKNKECNKWFWIDHPYHKLEAALLNLFEDLKITKQPKFKELQKLIKKTEEKICKEIDPNYITEKEFDKMHKNFKEEMA